MKLKQQMVLLITLALLVPTITITSISIYNIRSKAKNDIADFKQQEFVKLKLYLKHITDIAYGTLEVKHQALLQEDGNSSWSKEEITTWMYDNCLKDISQIRFDNGEGYFWVTDNLTPYPTMLMHAERQELRGVTLSAASYNVERYEKRNIYQVRAELSNKQGDAFVEYTMKKPGTDEIINKISYSRLYAPLGWIVSTGFYTDQIDRAVAEKEAALTSQITNIILSILTIALIIMVLGITVTYYFSKQLTQAIVAIKNKLADLAHGRQVEQVETKRKDEVADMTNSLNELVDGLKSYTAFAKEIGEGNLVQSFEPLSTEDTLGNELLAMRDNLKHAADEKAVRDWMNEGYAMLGEVLRSNNSDTKLLAEGVLKSLIVYVKANQGALFVLHTEDKKEQWLELLAAYAYDRKKFINRKIELGEGLAGQAALERATIHLREIPEKYVTITSGLGGAVPRSLIIVPLVYNDLVYGVIEIASFKHYAEHEIAFIEKIAESIASTIATVQTNERTRNLLEQSQQMAEELRAQEEEVRQNMEELSATQEQMTRQIEDNTKIQRDFQDREKVFSMSMILSEADVHGTITTVNDKFCQVSQYSREELIGKPHNILRHEDMPKELFQAFWDTIKSGRVFRGVIKNRAKDGSHYWVEATIMPVVDDGGKIVKYIGARYHITHEPLAQELYHEQALRLRLPSLETAHA